MSICREIPLPSEFYALLPQMGVARIGGIDARRFLQGQITQEVLTLAPGQAVLAACCNAQGRVRALFHVLANTNDELLLVMPAALIGGLLEALKKYAVFFKVQMSDVSEHWQIAGLKSAQASIAAARPEHTHCFNIAEQLYLCLSPAQTTISFTGLSECSPAEWDAAEIGAGLPQIAPETVEKFLPHSINLPALGGVSFKKGCYTGQEIVARMEYRGKLKSHLQAACCVSSEILAPGTEIMAGELCVGELIRASLSTTETGQSCVLLLVSIKDEALSQNCHLAVKGLPILEWLL